MVQKNLLKVSSCLHIGNSFIGAVSLMVPDPKNGLGKLNTKPTEFEWLHLI